MIEVTAVDAFEDNYIWIVRQKGNANVAIVDPGDEDPVLRYLHENALIPEAILITHHHRDHTGGIEGLLQHHQIPVYGPRLERIPHMTHPLGEGDKVVLAHAQLEFQVLDVPGHTKGHISYYGHDSLFCGDALFTAGCGRIFEGTPEQMHNSLTKFASLPDHSYIYCAHEYTLANLRFARIVEPDNTLISQRYQETAAANARGEGTVPALLSLEKATNPFLRSHINIVHAAAERFSQQKLDSDADVFATVRRWKDSLD